MLGTSIAAIHSGIGAEIIRVEADVSGGFPRFAIVGLPDSAVSESKLRIRSAFHNSGMQFPQGRITVNLTPANFRKRGSGLDLAIAIAILRASNQLPPDDGKLAFLAELQLSGELAPVESAVSLALRLVDAGTNILYLSNHQTYPQSLAARLLLVTFQRLTDVITAIRHGLPKQANTPSTVTPVSSPSSTDASLDDIIGRSEEKRLLSIAAAGKHHLLFIGPPGIGKTLLAKQLVHLLPDLDEYEALQAYARRETSEPAAFVTQRPPLRSPHHSLTPAGMIGGGSPPQPGEVTLAHGGVLMLDELFEFQRQSLNALREPMVDHAVHLTRAGKSVTLPADFLLVATANPCPCGLRGYGECRCLDSDVRRYWARCSGPLLDRIHIVAYLNRQEYVNAKANAPTRTATDSVSASGRALREQVETARQILAVQHDALPPGQEAGLLQASAERLFEQIQRIVASERASRQILSLARTIAALSARESIVQADLEEAFQLRNSPRT